MLHIIDFGDRLDLLTKYYMIQRHVILLLLQAIVLIRLSKQCPAEHTQTMQSSDQGDWHDFFVGCCFCSVLTSPKEVAK